MKKEFMGKHRKHFLTLVCLLVGMLVLTSAVYANYDSASGYTNYKNAVKNLLFTADNYTAEGSMTLSLDGKEMESFQGVAKLAEGDMSAYTKTAQEKIADQATWHEAWQYAQGNKSISYYPDENYYYEYEYDNAGKNTVLGMDDDTSDKATRFVELLADTLVGDLKNNVVLVSEKDGQKEYSIQIAKNQIPEVVNAGLSLMFTSYNNQDYSEYSFVTYDDMDETVAALYPEQGGESSTGTGDEITDEFSAVTEKYNQILEDKGNVGVVLVKEDGSYTYYPTYKEYTEAEKQMGSDDLMEMFGNDPYIDGVVFNATIDEKGRLVANSLEATLTGTDAKGERHTAKMTADIKLSDFGTTKPDVFDPEGKTKVNF